MSKHEIVFGTPEHIAGLSRRALEEDFRWVQDRRMELEDECERLDAENAKLRDELENARMRGDDLASSISEWRAVTEARWQTIDRLAAENAKLRKLARLMHGELVSCEDNGYICGGHKFDKRVRELGILEEVGQ